MIMTGMICLHFLLIPHDLSLVDSIWLIKPRNHVFKRKDRTDKESGREIFIDPRLIAEKNSSSGLIATL